MYFKISCHVFVLCVTANELEQAFLDELASMIQTASSVYCTAPQISTCPLNAACYSSNCGTLHVFVNENRSVHRMFSVLIFQNFNHKYLISHDWSKNKNDSHANRLYVTIDITGYQRNVPLKYLIVRGFVIMISWQFPRNLAN